MKQAFTKRSFVRSSTPLGYAEWLGTLAGIHAVFYSCYLPQLMWRGQCSWQLQALQSLKCNLWLALTPDR